VKQCDGENDSKPFRLSDWTANLPKLAPNKKVGLIDSGIGKNDATGHGTVMNYIIHQICPEAEIIDLKIFDKNGESTYLTLLEKINDALDVGCQVLNMSLSRKPDTSEELNSQLDGLESQIVKRY